VGGVSDEVPLRLDGGLEAREQVVTGIPGSSLSSSCGLSRAKRSCKLVEEILRPVPVMMRMGRNIRPATSQLANAASTATMARAIPELTRSWCASAVR
jgi:hypothetical protein